MTMSPAVGLGGKAPSLDFRNALLERFAICQKANQRMLGNMPGAAWHTAPPSGKGRTIALHDPAGKVPSCKPNVVTFIGFLIAHDSHHRGQIAMLARQVGHPVDRKTFYGRWEWGSLWRDCGFGSTTGGPGSK
jgi:hypothetical protein